MSEMQPGRNTEQLVQPEHVKQTQERLGGSGTEHIVMDALAQLDGASIPQGQLERLIDAMAQSLEGIDVFNPDVDLVYVAKKAGQVFINQTPEGIDVDVTVDRIVSQIPEGVRAAYGRDTLAEMVRSDWQQVVGPQGGTVEDVIANIIHEAQTDQYQEDVTVRVLAALPKKVRDAYDPTQLENIVSGTVYENLDLNRPLEDSVAIVIERMIQAREEEGNLAISMNPRLARNLRMMEEAQDRKTTKRSKIFVPRNQDGMLPITPKAPISPDAYIRQVREARNRSESPDGAPEQIVTPEHLATVDQYRLDLLDWVAKQGLQFNGQTTFATIDANPDVFPDPVFAKQALNRLRSVENVHARLHAQLEIPATPAHPDRLVLDLSQMVVPEEPAIELQEPTLGERTFSSVEDAQRVLRNAGIRPGIEGEFLYVELNDDGRISHMWVTAGAGIEGDLSKIDERLAGRRRNIWSIDLEEDGVIDILYDNYGNEIISHTQETSIEGQEGNRMEQAIQLFEQTPGAVVDIYGTWDGLSNQKVSWLEDGEDGPVWQQAQEGFENFGGDHLHGLRREWRGIQQNESNEILNNERNGIVYSDVENGKPYYGLVVRNRDQSSRDGFKACVVQFPSDKSAAAFAQLNEDEKLDFLLHYWNKEGAGLQDINHGAPDSSQLIDIIDPDVINTVDWSQYDQTGEGEESIDIDRLQQSIVRDPSYRAEVAQIIDHINNSPDASGNDLAEYTNQAFDALQQRIVHEVTRREEYRGKPELQEEIDQAVDEVMEIYEQEAQEAMDARSNQTETNPDRLDDTPEATPDTDREPQEPRERSDSEGQTTTESARDSEPVVSDAEEEKKSPEDAWKDYLNKWKKGDTGHDDIQKALQNVEGDISEDLQRKIWLRDGDPRGFFTGYENTDQAVKEAKEALVDARGRLEKLKSHTDPEMRKRYRKELGWFGLGGKVKNLERQVALTDVHYDNVARKDKHKAKSAEISRTLLSGNYSLLGTIPRGLQWAGLKGLQAKAWTESRITNAQLWNEKHNRGYPGAAIVRGVLRQGLNVPRLAGGLVTVAALTPALLVGGAGFGLWATFKTLRSGWKNKENNWLKNIGDVFNTWG